MRVNTNDNISNTGAQETIRVRSSMSQSPRHDLVRTPVLNDVERTELEPLAEVCNRHTTYALYQVGAS